MKYLVTGGLGFIGNEVVRQLLQDNHEVVVIDNNSSVAPNIDDIIHKTRLHKADITHADAVEAIIKDEKPDNILHLAAIHYIPICNQFPIKTHAVNVTGTMHILESASKYNISNCTLLSSGSIYADSDVSLDEDKSACKIFDTYSYSKMAVENLGKLYAIRNPSTKYNIIRLFNVYGARETNPHIIPEILGQLRLGNILNLGNISPKRDFIHVKDAASGIISITNRERGDNMEIINLCSGVDYSMSEVITIIAELLHREIKIEINPEKFRTQDKLFQKGSTQKLFALTGFRCKYQIKEGIRELLIAENLI